MSGRRAGHQPLLSDLRDHFAGSRWVLLGIGGIVLAVYGFELFSFNLTIDEEIHAFAFDPAGWVSQGRWGMYLLNRVVLPYTVVPVVSLAIGLTLHFAAVVLMLRAWDVRDHTTQFLTGAIAIATPTLAYSYTFSTIAYGMGAGFFLAALAACLFFVPRGRSRYWAAIPVAAAFGTYQAFGLLLATLFLVGFVRRWLEGDTSPRLVAHGLGVGAAGGAASLAAQWGFTAVLHPPPSDYVDQILYPSAFFDHPGTIVRKVASVVARVYSGDADVYAHLAYAVPLVIVASLVVLAWRSRTAATAPVWRLAAFGTGAAILVVPFIGGLVSNGNIAIRFLVAVPFALAGLVSIGVPGPGRGRLLFVGVSALLLIQFATATNSLFGASHLALEQDRLLGGAMITAIRQEMADAGERPDYLFVVGIPTRHATPLVPRIDTFGASFFEWDGGNGYRSSAFLETLGFDDLAPLPRDRYAEFVAAAAGMPDFPAHGSTLVVGDTVVIRLSEVSRAQRNFACDTQSLAEVCS